MSTRADTRLRDTAEKLIEFVRLGFHDCSLHFTVRLGLPDRLGDVLDAAGGYNDFDPVRVRLEVELVAGELMSIEFGREDGPVLYVEVPYWSHQQMGWGGEPKGGGKLAPRQRQRIGGRAIAALRCAGARSVSLVAGEQYGSAGLELRNPDALPMPGDDVPLRIRATW